MRLATYFFLALLCVRADTLQEILDRMDVNAQTFHGATAQLKRLEYNKVLKENSDPESATMTLWKGKKGVIGLLDFTAPDVKDMLFKDGQVQVYLPKVNTVQEYDLGKHSQVVNQFVTLGFGGSGKDLQKSYKIDHRGSQVLKIADKDVKVTMLELTPKSPEALEYMKKIEFWIPDGTSYAVQMKIYQPSGDTNTAIYSNVQINPPGLSEHSVELKTPKNAKREKMN
jgi:outer membrane lipoprotein-sorting protein